MKVRFTERAADELEDILTYVAAHSPQGAAKVKRRIKLLTDLISRHPEAGQRTNRAGLRRIVVQPYPYLLFYQVAADEIVIHGLRHAARRPL